MKFKATQKVALVCLNRKTFPLILPQYTVFLGKKYILHPIDKTSRETNLALYLEDLAKGSGFVF